MSEASQPEKATPSPSEGIDPNGRLRCLPDASETLFASDIDVRPLSAEQIADVLQYFRTGEPARWREKDEHDVRKRVPGARVKSPEYYEQKAVNIPIGQLCIRAARIAEVPSPKGHLVPYLSAEERDRFIEAPNKPTIPAPSHAVPEHRIAPKPTWGVNEDGRDWAQLAAGPDS